MAIHRAFDEVFRSWSHVAVLRTLVDTTTGRTGNEVARLSGMHPLTALKALSSLEELGIVRRQRGGRDHIFTLNREHFLVRSAILPLYKSESEFETEIFGYLASLLKKNVVSAVIFGSTARGEETATSDLDVCCIVENDKRKENVRSLLDGKSSQLHDEFGIRLSPIFFTVSEAKGKKNSSLFKKIVKEGKRLVGKKLEAVIGS